MVTPTWTKQEKAWYRKGRFDESVGNSDMNLRVKKATKTRTSRTRTRRRTTRRRSSGLGGFF